MNNMKNRGIEVLIKKLNSSNIWAYLFFLRYRWSHFDPIESNYIHGNVDRLEIERIIQQSNTYHFIRWMIPSIFNMIDSDSFVDSVVDTCLRYPLPWRNTLLEIIAHKDLSNDNLIRINELISSPEAFYRIIIHFLSEPVDNSTFRDFLCANNRFRTEFKNNGQNIIEKYQCSNNTILIKELEMWQHGDLDSSTYY